jgi:hypothetical protein
MPGREFRDETSVVGREVQVLGFWEAEVCLREGVAMRSSTDSSYLSQIGSIL